VSGARGLLWPRPIIPGAQAAASQSPDAGNAYLLLRAPRVEEGRQDGQIGDEILPARTHRRVKKV
jgi:hypothetical protein